MMTPTIRSSDCARFVSGIAWTLVGEVLARKRLKCANISQFRVLFASTNSDFDLL